MIVNFRERTAALLAGWLSMNVVKNCKKVSPTNPFFSEAKSKIWDRLLPDPFMIRWIAYWFSERYDHEIMGKLNKIYTLILSGRKLGKERKKLSHFNGEWSLIY